MSEKSKLSSDLEILMNQPPRPQSEPVHDKEGALKLFNAFVRDVGVKEGTAWDRIFVQPIRAALSPKPAEGMEGLDEAIAECSGYLKLRYALGMTKEVSDALGKVIEAARLYASGHAPIADLEKKTMSDDEFDEYYSGGGAPFDE